MRILIVCPVFPPEPVTSATTTAHLAAALTAKGHVVTVITSCPSRPGGKVYEGYRRGFARRERSREGYTIIRTWSILPTGSSTRARMLENISFGACAMAHALFRSSDAVFQNNWPILASGMIALACRIRRVPLISSIQDIHPEAALHAGKISSRRTPVRCMQALDGVVARQAAALLVISRQFASFYKSARRVPADRIRVVPNWMDESEIVPGDKAGAFRAALGLDSGAFVGLFAGNIGEVADVESLVSAAALLSDLPSFRLVIVGDGARRRACESLAASLALTNVRFYHPWLAETPSDVHAAADVLLLPTRASGAVSSVPSKLIGYMLSGRAVVAAVDEGSESHRVVAEAGCGVTVPPGDPKALAAAIRLLVSDPNGLARRGERARLYAEAHFSRQPCVDRVVAIIEAAAEGIRLPGDLESGVGSDPSDGPSASERSAGCRERVVVVPMAAMHVDAVARLHARNLSDHFASSMGERLLRVHYRSLAECAGANGIVATIDGEVAGYVCGVWDFAELRRSLIRRVRLVDVIPLVIWSLLHPWESGMAMRRMSHADEDRGGYELRPLVVRSGARRRGIAVRLVRELLADAASRGWTLVHLYVEPTNAPARALYARMGFVMTGQSSRFGVDVQRLECRLDPTAFSQAEERSSET